MNDTSQMTGHQTSHLNLDNLPGQPDLIYLQAHLARIDVLISQQVERWQTAGQDPYDAFRGLYVSDSEARNLTQRPFGHSWGQTIILPDERVQHYSAELQKANAEVARIGALFAQAKILPRLDYLAFAFGLDQFDLDALLICLAPSLDLRYERIFGYLQDDVSKKRPSVNLVLDLLSLPGTPHLQYLTRFSNQSQLIKFQILEKYPQTDVLIANSLRVDETIVNWLLGSYQPQTELGTAAALQFPLANQTDSLLANTNLSTQKLEQLHALCNPEQQNLPPLISFYGANETSQQSAVRVLCSSLNRVLLSVDLAVALANGLSPARAVSLALRDARLTGSILYIYHWEACLPAEGSREPPNDMVIDLINYTDLVIISSKNSWRLAEIDRQRRIISLDFPTPGFQQRLAIWEHFLGEEVKQVAENSTMQLLAGQFKLNPSQIRDAVAAARDRSNQDNSPIDSQLLFSTARSHSNPNLASLARKIIPRFDWSDIILPGDQIAQLTEIITTVRGRPLVLESWGVGSKLTSSQGVTILFAGPPGTGKTMAAEVLARELGLDLYKIDLSTVVSKYIGETEKNLEKIFHEAASSNAILFFDEADAIFGKRSEVKDAHDRYANIEISYLLQRMEAYDGVTILATNLRANLDEAFTRRLQFAIDFPFPEEADRLRIWTTLFPPDVPRAENLDFKYLSRRFKLAGGNIRNIIVSASFLAAADGGVVKMEHLLHGTRREMQKMGRLVEDERW